MSWLLVATVPALLILAVIGLDRIEAGLASADGGAVLRGRVDPPMRWITSAVNPQVQRIPQPDRV